MRSFPVEGNNGRAGRKVPESQLPLDTACNKKPPDSPEVFRMSEMASG
jgi:hypothetical protein